MGQEEFLNPKKNYQFSEENMSENTDVQDPRGGGLVICDLGKNREG